MVVRVPKEEFFPTRDPARFRKEMLRDVALLWELPAYTSCLTLVVCFIDVLASGTGGADKAKFTRFMEEYFRPLCDELAAVAPGKPGAVTFYEEFRNGLAHLRGPRTGFAMARDSDTAGKYVEVFDVEEQGRVVGINVDRLYADFVTAVNRLSDGAT